MYIHKIYYESNIFQEFWVNLLVSFLQKNLVLLIILLPLDKILNFLYARHLTDVLCYGAVRLSVRTSVRPYVRT